MQLSEHRAKRNKQAAKHRNDRIMEPASLSDIGLERGVNEDRCAMIHSASAVCHLVLDGMGGVEGGEFAAQLGIDAISRYVEGLSAHRLTDPAACLREALVDANRVITLRRQSKTFSQMGTTVVGALIDGSALTIGHVGDSRAYLISDGNIRQITVDHTYVQMLVEQQEICREDAMTHPQAHILTQCLGASNDVKVDIHQFWIWPPQKGCEGDILLLCSDGLYSLVHDGEMASVISSLAPHDACEELVRLANARGGYDNITVSIIPLEGCVKDEVAPAWKNHVASREKIRRRELWWSMPVESHLLRALILSAATVCATAGVFFVKLLLM